MGLKHLIGEFRNLRKYMRMGGGGIYYGINS